MSTAAKRQQPSVQVRPATPEDLDTLSAFEVRIFSEDRISRQGFRRFLASPTAALGIAEVDGKFAGYALVIFRANTSLARLYSIAVDPVARGVGLGARLLEWAEAASLERGAAMLRLEVRPDNAAAIGLYRRHGYQEFAVYPDYYEDHSAALRMQKTLIPETVVMPSRVSYYNQTMEFTCGAAALLMAMHALDPAVAMTQRDELAIWREATTVFMTSGHGGCGPHGLALAAHARGFDAELYVSDSGPLFLSGVRQEKKKDVLRLVHEDFSERVAAAGIPLHVGALSLADLEGEFAAGKSAIALISQYRILGDKAPHWVAIAGFDEKFIYVSDPDFGEDDYIFTGTDCLSIPITRRDFELMAKYGRSHLQAVVVLSRR